jgi:hypothetical protein
MWQVAHACAVVAVAGALAGAMVQASKRTCSVSVAPPPAFRHCVDLRVAWHMRIT